jgi:hypothetical protein
MDRLLLSILLGVIIGIIDIIPMIIKKLPRYSTISAFFHFFFTTIVIVNIDIPYIVWWLEGAIIGFALMIPMLIHVGHSDKKPLPIIAINAIVLGSVAGIVSHFFM